MTADKAPPATENITAAPADSTFPVPKTRLQALKGTLKNTFTKKAIVGYVKENWDTALVTTAGSAALKIAVFSCSASFAASSAGIITLAVTGGVLSTALRHGYKLARAEKGEARDKLRLTNAQFAQKLLTGAAMGGLFSGLGIGLGHLWTVMNETCNGGPKGLTSFLTQHQSNAPAPSITEHAAASPPVAPDAPAVPDAPVAAATPDVPANPAPASAIAEAAAPEAPAAPVTPDAITPAPLPHVMKSPLDAIKEYAAQNNNVSAKLKDALLRVESTNPRIHAQALDDIAVYAPKSLQVQAYDLLQQSASLGNLKAKADMITMEFYGNKVLGIKADPEAAVDKMVALSKHSKYAAKMVAEWVGPSPSPAAVSVAAPLQQFNIPAGVSQVTTVDLTALPEITQPIVPANAITMPTGVTPIEAPAPVVAPVETAPVSIPVTTPAALPVTPIAPVVEASPDCTVTVDPTNVQNLILSCDVNAGDMDLTEGEVIYVKRPSVPVMIPR